MKQSQFYYLLRRGLLKSMSVVREGLVMFNKFTTAGISHPAQGSAEFDGASDYIDTGAQLISTNHTIQAWVYRDSSGTNDVNYVLAMRDAANDGLLVFSRSNTSISIKFDAQTEIQYTSFTSDEWHHIASTYDGTTEKFYFNGSVVGTGTFSDTLSVTADTIIGRDSGSGTSNFWDGNLANVAIWNRALSSDEINSVMWKPYQALTTNEQSGLQAWYSLDDISSPSASLATMEALAVDKDATIENKAAITAAINALS